MQIQPFYFLGQGQFTTGNKRIIQSQFLCKTDVASPRQWWHQQRWLPSYLSQTNNELKDNIWQSITRCWDCCCSIFSATFVEEPQLAHRPDWLCFLVLYKRSNLFVFFVFPSQTCATASVKSLDPNISHFPLIYLFCMCLKAFKQNLQVLARHLV